MRIAEVSRKYDIPQDTLRYYERINAIPQVSRDKGGIRNYTEEDCRWIEQAKCLRNAGLTIEAVVEYRRLFLLGDDTIPARLELLKEQRNMLLEQRKSIDLALERLNFKVSRYEKAMETGILSWEPEE